MDLQTALRAVLPRLEPRAAAPAPTPQPMPEKRATARKAPHVATYKGKRLVRLANAQGGIFDCGRKAFDTCGSAEPRDQKPARRIKSNWPSIT